MGYIQYNLIPEICPGDATTRSAMGSHLGHPVPPSHPRTMANQTGHQATDNRTMLAH